MAQNSSVCKSERYWEKILYKSFTEVTFSFSGISCAAFRLPISSAAATEMAFASPIPLNFIKSLIESLLNFCQL